MAEVKNNFLGAKMNRDIDDRLLSSNEYREAFNLQINRSEGSDVGTLQNVLGNSLIVDFNYLNGEEGLECIGLLADDSNDNIYVFLTDYSGSAYSNTSLNYIYVYNQLENTTVLLTSGAFLNFSTQSPIYGINLLENLLFWTDNRNQPRKINVDKASIDPNYYLIEDQISVSKLSPQQAPELFTISEFYLPLSVAATVGTVTAPTSPAVSPYTAVITPSTTFAESLLSIGNVVLANVGSSSFTKGVVTAITLSGSNVASFTVSSSTIFTSGNISLLKLEQYETTMYDRVSAYLPNGTTANPYKPLDKYPGDPAYLESRFVRFSYRYKFDDGEYSIIAPFTQIAYIPKQDGYFLYNATSSPIVNDEESTYRSTVVSFMQNKANNILLQIPLPSAANELNLLYKITEIEILYKESDAVAISVVEAVSTIPNLTKGTVEDPYIWNTEGKIYSYNYQAKKPFKTLPSSDSIRVNDIVPVKALGQEIISNRVVYANYQDKFSYPKYLDYNVGFSTKFNFGFLESQGTSIVEYPNHSVKLNRNYQIGIVLCDKFGRQSGVILSDLIKSSNPGEFGASSLYIPYPTENEITPSNWPGNSLKILFNNKISPTGPDLNNGWPGLYNGNIYSADYNPLGWYAYKIVVKQTEQDYYNVYFPGVMASYPGVDGYAKEIGKTSHAVLINDNINKVPRDLSEVGPNQKQFRSSVILYSRVNNNTENWRNNQAYPGNTYAFSSAIATGGSLFYPDGVIPLQGTSQVLPFGFNQFYQIDSDPLISRISTFNKLGVSTDVPSGKSVINLAIYETKPVESRIDVYWETSTSGLISELNSAIDAGTGGNNVSRITEFTFDLSEDAAPGTNVSGIGFRFFNSIDIAVVPTTVEIFSVKNQLGTTLTNKFIIERIGSSTRYIIKTRPTVGAVPGAYFYYGLNAVNVESYNFIIKTTIGSPVSTELITLSANLLKNKSPIISSALPIPNPIELASGTPNVWQFTGSNGSNQFGNRTTEDLTWDINQYSLDGQGTFTINQYGLVQESSGLAQGSTLLVINLTDAGNVTVYQSITVKYPFREGEITIINNSPIGDNSEVGPVLVNGIEVALNSGNEFPANAQDVLIGTYDVPTDPIPHILEVYIFSAAGQVLTLCVGDVCQCKPITSPTTFIEFDELDLNDAPALTLTLGAPGVTCPV